MLVASLWTFAALDVLVGRRSAFATHRNAGLLAMSFMMKVQLLDGESWLIREKVATNSNGARP